MPQMIEKYVKYMKNICMFQSTSVSCTQRQLNANYDFSELLLEG